MKIPIVIKAATDQPTGGGRHVAICHNNQEFKKAQKKFANCELIVMEEYVPIKKNYCVQFAKTFDVLGQEIMKSACSMGYRGIAGFDIVLTDDDRILAIDLNFRLNGSTAALLLCQSMFKNRDASVLLFSSWKTTSKFNHFLSVCQKAIKAGYLLPLSVYNPESSPLSKSVTRLSAMLLGTSKRDIINRRLPHFKNSLRK